jgi:hypothetical protein
MISFQLPVCLPASFFEVANVTDVFFFLFFSPRFDAADKEENFDDAVKKVKGEKK